MGSVIVFLSLGKILRLKKQILGTDYKYTDEGIRLTVTVKI